MSKITRQLQADRIIVRQPCDKAVIDLQCACIHYGFCFCIKVHHMNHMDIQVILHSALCCFEGFCRDTLLHVICMYSYNNHRSQIAANVNHQCLHSGIASWWFRVTFCTSSLYLCDTIKHSLTLHLMNENQPKSIIKVWILFDQMIACDNFSVV